LPDRDRERVDAAEKRVRTWARRTSAASAPRSGCGSRVDDKNLGGLNLYSTSTDTIGPDVEYAAGIFAVKAPWAEPDKSTSCPRPWNPAGSENDRRPQRRHLQRTSGHRQDNYPHSQETAMPKGDIEAVYVDGQWTNQIEGEGPSHHLFETKDKAVAEGRRLAHEAEVEHIIKNQDGTIADRSAYRHGPRDVSQLIAAPSLTGPTRDPTGRRGRRARGGRT